jgi:hypothetical protein
LTLLGHTLPEEIKVEPLEKPEGYSKRRRGRKGSDGEWRGNMEFWSEWEALGGVLPAQAFVRNGKRMERRKERRRTEIIERKGVGSTSDHESVEGGDLDEMVESEDGDSEMSDRDEDEEVRDGDDTSESGAGLAGELRQPPTISERSSTSSTGSSTNSHTLEIDPDVRIKLEK